MVQRCLQSISGAEITLMPKEAKVSNVNTPHHRRFCPMDNTVLLYKDPFIRVSECVECGVRVVAVPKRLPLTLTRLYAHLILRLKFKHTVHWYSEEDF